MLHYMLVIAACLRLVLGQCDGPSISITSNDDSLALSNCAQYNGNIIIDPNFAGSASLQNVQTISGDLTITNVTSLSTLTATKLETVGGTFYVADCVIMSEISMPALRRVGILHLDGMPSLQQIDFGQGLESASEVHISNTQLFSTAGLELKSVDVFDINNNPYLKTAHFNDITEITSSFSAQDNGNDLEILLPKLQSAPVIAVHNVTTFSAPSLNEVVTSLDLSYSRMTTYVADSLSKSGNFTIIGSDLEDLDLPSLVYVDGSLTVVNNTFLGFIAMDKLATVDGNIILAGSFESLSFNSLSSVTGQVNVSTSSSNSSICDLVNRAKERDVIKGQVLCATNAISSDPSSNGTGTDGNITTIVIGTRTTISGTAIGGISAGAVVAVGAILAAIFKCFIQPWKRKSGGVSSREERHWPWFRSKRGVANVAPLATATSGSRAMQRDQLQRDEKKPNSLTNPSSKSAPVSKNVDQVQNEPVKYYTHLDYHGLAPVPGEKPTQPEKQ